MTSKYYKGKARSRVAQPWSYSRIAKMRYVDDFDLEATNTTSTSYLFRANDLYDPNYTGTGHQPRGFDQWTSMYNKFVVIGSKATVHFAIQETEAGTDGIVGIRTDTLNNSVISINDEMENRRSKYRVLTGNSNRDLVITNNFSFKQWIKGKPLTETSCHGIPTASPTNLVYYHVFAGPNNPGATPPVVRCVIQIDYIAIMFDPINPSQS